MNIITLRWLNLFFFLFPFPFFFFDIYSFFFFCCLKNNCVFMCFFSALSFFFLALYIYIYPSIYLSIYLYIYIICYVCIYISSRRWSFLCILNGVQQLRSKMKKRFTSIRVSPLFFFFLLFFFSFIKFGVTYLYMCSLSL